MITNWINKPTLNSSSWRPLGNVCVYAVFQLVSVEDPGHWLLGSDDPLEHKYQEAESNPQTQVISMKTGGREWKCCRVAGWSGFEHQLCDNYMLTPWSTQFLIYRWRYIMKIMPMGHSADWIQFPPTSWFCLGSFLSRASFMDVTCAITQGLLLRGLRAWLHALLPPSSHS